MSQTCPYCGEDIKETAVKCRSCGEWLDALAANEDALSCPHCGQGEADRQQRQQQCARCRKNYVLYPGPRMEHALLPGDEGKSIVSRSTGLVMRMQAEVGPDGFAFGNLDPITGMVPMDSQRVAYGDVVSITTWQRLDWRVLIMATVVLVPLSLLFLAGALKTAALALIGLPFWLLTGLSFYRAVGIGAHRMRVCGVEKTLEFRFDAPVWRRKRFLREALRRSGIDAPLASPGG